MRALILASDSRTALAPSKAGGKPALSFILSGLLANKVVQVGVVHEAEHDDIRQHCMLEHPEHFYEFIEVDDPEATGTTYAFHIARDFFAEDDELLVINGNVAFEPKLITHVLEHEGSGVAADWGTYDEASRKIAVREGHVLSISRDQFREETFGRSIGVFKFNRAHLDFLSQEVARGIESFREKDMPLEAVLDRLCLSGALVIDPCKIEGARWAVATATKQPPARRRLEMLRSRLTD